jgi:hypothetical protein
MEENLAKVQALRDAMARVSFLELPWRGQEHMVVNCLDMVAVGAMTPQLAAFIAAAANAAPYLLSLAPQERHE